MLIVVDANELFSLLIKGTPKSESIFFSDNLKLIAPELLLSEFSKHKQEILSKSGRSKSDFLRLVSILGRMIEFIYKEEFEEFIPRALKLFPEHTKDVQYLALALRFNCILWFEEKLLKRQSSVRVLNTEELFNSLTLE